MKNDAILQAWVPRAHVALVAQWLEKHGMRVTSLSSITRHLIAQATKRALEEDMKMPSTEEAEGLLEGLTGRAHKLNPSGRRIQNLFENLQEEERKEEGTLNIDKELIERQIKQLKRRGR